MSPANHSRQTALLRRLEGVATYEMLAQAGIVLLVLLLSRTSLSNANIDDLDSAHHLMDGYFFRDLMVDHPVRHTAAYVLAYYKQYPALGFLFWPPLFPAVLGVFCLVGGVNVLAARACMVFFGLVFALCFYRLCRREFSVWLGFAATAGMIAVPGVAWSFNQIMLELPTLAMMCVAILAYLYSMERIEEPFSMVRTLACSCAIAAVVYTKQPAWFLYPVLGLEFCVLRRRSIRKPAVWVMLATTAALCVPLALFTLKFGHADLAQSVGSNTRLIMKQYASLPRWSVAAWTYYPKLAFSSLNALTIVLTLGAFVFAAARKAFLRAHIVWFGWFVFAYLTFSYYDNRLPRHATFWWPAWCFLAAACVSRLTNWMPRRWVWVLPALLLLPVPLEMRRVWRTDYNDYRNVESPLAELFANGPTGNILVFGKDKQVFVALIREHDLRRDTRVLRGDRLLDTGETVASLCRRYRIGTVLVESTGPEELAIRRGQLDANPFTTILDSSILKRGTTVPLTAYRYLGPMNAVADDVSLSKGLL